jgi:peptide deformylase
MQVRPILTLPDPRLRLLSTPVAKVDSQTRELLDDMLATMYDAPGIGLAAIQIAVPLRALVIDLAKDGETPQPQCFVNPEFLWLSPETSPYDEGCLSIPEVYEEVVRPSRLRIRYLDRDGQECEREADGLLATALQHEMDHLNGTLFIDHISRLKRGRIMRKFEKIARHSAPHHSEALADR